MSEMQPPNGAPRCERSDAQQMRLRLAKSRLREAEAADNSVAHPAALLLTIGQLILALKDVITLAEEGCSEDGPHA